MSFYEHASQPQYLETNTTLFVLFDTAYLYILITEIIRRDIIGCEVVIRYLCIFWSTTLGLCSVFLAYLFSPYYILLSSFVLMILL